MLHEPSGNDPRQSNPDHKPLTLVSDLSSHCKTGSVFSPTVHYSLFWDFYQMPYYFPDIGEKF